MSLNAGSYYATCLGVEITVETSSGTADDDSDDDDNL